MRREYYAGFVEISLNASCTLIARLLQSGHSVQTNFHWILISSTPSLPLLLSFRCPASKYRRARCLAALLLCSTGSSCLAALSTESNRGGIFGRHDPFIRSAAGTFLRGEVPCEPSHGAKVSRSARTPPLYLPTHPWHVAVALEQKSNL